ncbi:MAG: DUF4199 domain-containing protein [Prevotella sp.]|nr:DUF4199 domain-containing protein [Prevotella sp.]
MPTYGEYIQLKAFARVDGAIMGALWVISFASFVLSFSYPVLGTCSLILGIVSLVLNIMRLRAFRNEILEGAISFRRAFFYSMLTYLYASIILVLAQLIYFKFIDHGTLMGQYLTLLSSDNLRQALMQAYGITDKELSQAVSMLRAMRPTDIALQFFMMNLFMGVVISLPTALFIRKSRI